MNKKRSPRDNKRAKNRLKKLANAFIIIGLIFLAVPAGFWVNTAYYQWEQAREWKQRIVSGSDDSIRTLRQSKAGQGVNSKRLQQSGDGREEAVIEDDFISSPSELIDKSPAKTGDSIAYIEIPGIDLRASVIEGEAWTNLAKGPVRVRKTARIGDKGTTLISGHRTMYGAPFHDLHKLELSDKIILYTGKALFVYTITGIKKVDPDDWSDIKPDSGPQLVLSTCEPMYSAKKRLLIITRLSDARRL